MSGAVGPLVIRPPIGVQDLVYAILTESSDVLGGTPVYGAVKKLSGLAKLQVKVGGQVTSIYGDDVVAAVGASVGKKQVSLELIDILPDGLADILGLSLVNGQYVESSLDQPPYVAVGFKQLLLGNDLGNNQVFLYHWLFKGKFAKPDFGGDTKADSIKNQVITLAGEFADLFATKSYHFACRTDDTRVPAAVLTNFFSQPMLTPNADTSALSCAIAKSGTGIAFTFTKASGGTFSMAEASAVLGKTILVSEGGAEEGGSLAFSGEGTAAVIATYTPSVSLSGTVIAAVTEEVKDANGVACTPDLVSLSF
jgi:phi13 family phage major tail protein